MNLQEILDQLTFGELSQIKMGGGEEGVLSEANYKRVLPHINLGLTTLYRRFLLKESRVKLELQADRFVYPINSDFAVSKRRSRETVRYLIDTVDEPFEDDIIKILRVYTVPTTIDGCPFEMSLNDRNNPWSVMTPSSLVLRVPEKLATQVDVPVELITTHLMIDYCASHPLIVQDPDDDTIIPAEIEVELPYSHLEALLLFVASRVHNPIGMTNEFHAGNSYAAKFEMACKQLELDNALVDQGSQNNRLRSKGWA